jgi:integrase
VFDDELPGFGVRVKASGAKSWLIQYRNAHGRSRRFTFARYGVLTPDKARKRAKGILGDVSKGADPAAEKRSARAAATVAELWDQYLEAGKGEIKESTLAVDRSRIERHVKPLLGSRAVASLTPADMEHFVRDVMTGKTAPKAAPKKGEKRKRGGVTTGGPGVASRTLGMLGTILQRAVRDGALASNPVRGVKRPKDKAKKPPFSFEAIAAVGDAIRAREAAGENISGLRAIRFLILTGLRRMEALTLTWGLVDRRARCIRFADTKSGAQTRPLGRAPLDWLASFEPKDVKGTDYVFPGAEDGKHLVGLPKVWERVAKEAKIGDVSLHGLRHWFASAAAEMNFSELTIAGLLGHRVKGVTARYATAPDSALLAAADRVSLRIADVLDGCARATNVISLSA